jgi:hypothetical protein
VAGRPSAVPSPHRAHRWGSDLQQRATVAPWLSRHGASPERRFTTVVTHRMRQSPESSCRVRPFTAQRAHHRRHRQSAHRATSANEICFACVSYAEHERGRGTGRGGLYRPRRTLPAKWPETSDTNASGRALHLVRPGHHSRMVIGPGRWGCHAVRDLHTRRGSHPANRAVRRVRAVAAQSLIVRPRAGYARQGGPPVMCNRVPRFVRALL